MQGRLWKQTHNSRQLIRGFTIVELLIVVVVIATLAAITLVTYRGVQSSARDSQRVADVATITRALELYYIDNGRFPTASGSTSINSSWSTTADDSWANLEAQLVPKYISKLPTDPISTAGISIQSSGYNYAYFTTSSSGVTYCGAVAGQMYLLLFRRESGERVDRMEGACPTSPLLYDGVSNVRVVK